MERKGELGVRPEVRSPLLHTLYLAPFLRKAWGGSKEDYARRKRKGLCMGSRPPKPICLGTTRFGALAQARATRRNWSTFRARHGQAADGTRLQIPTERANAVMCEDVASNNAPFTALQSGTKRGAERRRTSDRSTHASPFVACCSRPIPRPRPPTIRCPLNRFVLGASSDRQPPLSASYQHHRESLAALFCACLLGLSTRLFEDEESATTNCTSLTNTHTHTRQSHLLSLVTSTTSWQVSSVPIAIHGGNRPVLLATGVQLQNFLSTRVQRPDEQYVSGEANAVLRSSNFLGPENLIARGVGCGRGVSNPAASHALLRLACW